MCIPMVVIGTAISLGEGTRGWSGHADGWEQRQQMSFHWKVFRESS